MTSGSENDLKKEATSVKIADGETLTFSEAKQDALLGHLLVNEQFFLQARTKIEGSWFLDPWSSQIWEAKKEFYEKWQRVPTEEELRNCTSISVKDQAAKNKIYAKMAKVLLARQQYGLDVMRQELTTWLRTRIFKAYLEKASEVYNAADGNKDSEKKFGEAFFLIKKASHEIDKASFENVGEVDFSDLNGFFDRQQMELQNAITLGCPALDSRLNPDCASGSLLRGDMTVLLAPTNVGKTTTMINASMHNVMLGKSVLLITHEGRPDDIKTKILQCITKSTRTDLMNLTKTVAGQQLLARYAELLRRFFVFCPIHKPGLTVEDAEVTIRRLQEKRVAEYGRGFDLIVDDYPAKLTTAMASKGNLQKRFIDDHVYNYFSQMALEFNCHILAAAQTNREASKINRGMSSEERLITLEDVAESFAITQTATNVISLNRDEMAKAKERMTFHICKSRSNDTGWSVVTKTNFKQARTHGADLPATYYRGISTLADKIDDLLSQYADKPIPESLYFI